MCGVLLALKGCPQKYITGIKLLSSDPDEQGGYLTRVAARKRIEEWMWENRFPIMSELTPVRLLDIVQSPFAPMVALAAFSGSSDSADDNRAVLRTVA